MKKLFIFFSLLAIPAAYSLQAQTFDTVYGRQPQYYYTYWYDTAEWYLNPDSVPTVFSSGCIKFHQYRFDDRDFSPIRPFIAQMHTDNPLKVKGVAMMVSNCAGNPDNPRIPGSTVDYVLDSV